MFTLTQSGELECSCGNVPSSSGFDPCDAAGKVDESLLDADNENELHWLCLGCGKVSQPLEELIETDVMMRHANKSLMINWINRDLLNRAHLDVRKSFVFYDSDKMFEFALPELPSVDMCNIFVSELGVRFWSKGIV